MTDRELAIKLKIDKAESIMDEVKILIENNFYNTAVSRLYYSCFHATRALLLTKELIPKTHSGVISNLHKYFVAEGNFDNNHAAFFARLMKERMEDDYNDFIIKDLEEIEAYIEPAREYLSCITFLIKKTA